MPPTKIAIYHQHLLGNDPEGFNSALWLERLATDYEKQVRAHYPEATIEVKIDIQRASGYCKPVSYTLEIDGVADLDNALEASIESASGYLWDRIGSDAELYEESA